VAAGRLAHFEVKPQFGATSDGSRTSMDEDRELHVEFREPIAPLETHVTHKWRGVSVQYSRLKLPAEYAFQWDGNCHYLAYHDLVLTDGEMEITGERPITGRDLRDTMTYVPAGQAIHGWAKPTTRMNAFTVVCFDPALVEEELQVAFNGVDLLPSIYFNDVHLGSTMRKLGTLMVEDETPTSKLYVETLALTAALEMFRIAMTQAPAEGKISAPGQLGRTQRDLVTAYIEARISTDIGLDELANLCGLTRFHFSRVFKATFGETPIQYVTLRRIEKARQMLGETRLPVAHVATACGFSGASQFGRAFRAIVGLTPLAFRRSV
jgi:AraC family transcriptional regulator